jgi:hypothetical protein
MKKGAKETTEAIERLCVLKRISAKSEAPQDFRPSFTGLVAASIRSEEWRAQRGRKQEAFHSLENRVFSVLLMLMDS